MNIFYKDITVNGFDIAGGLWFSESFTGSQEDLALVFYRAYSVKGVCIVKLDLAEVNLTFYDSQGCEIPKGE